MSKKLFQNPKKRTSKPNYNNKCPKLNKQEEKGTKKKTLKITWEDDSFESSNDKTNNHEYQEHCIHGPKQRS